MDVSAIEKKYPITFRHADAQKLGRHLKHRHSVELVGMKRVGISNFLRFFLTHTDVVKTYIGAEKHIFITVDLHDLIEQELFPFWVLTFKRLLDTVEELPDHKELKESISTLFLNSVQLQDHFLTIENLKKSINELIKAGFTPTIFFIRFDRIAKAATKQLLENLQGLTDASNHRLCYVFTSYRCLDQIAPNAFPRIALTGFAHTMYLLPAKPSDTQLVFDSFEKKYKTHAHEETISQLIELSGGHVQYLHLLLLILHDQKTSVLPQFEEIAKDERIAYLFDEICESLTSEEQNTLKKIAAGEELTKTNLEHSKYLWLTGFLNTKNKIFSRLFESFLTSYKSSDNEAKKTYDTEDFTKKELALFTLLKNNLDQICERDFIADTVWPEIASEGVSDWTIDRLVARVRSKLKKQKSEYSITTVKTRGYKLIKS